MDISKYVINDAGLPIIFSTDIDYSAILTTVLSGGYVIIAFDSTSQYYFASCFTDELFDFKSRLIDSYIVEKHLNGCLYEDKVNGNNFDSISN